jgi:hypothetical protein
MPKKIHIANTFFEWELEHSHPITLYQAFHRHPVFLQLQFLPLVYASPNDAFMTSEELHSHSIDQECTIESWGASLLIKQWAQEQGLHYPMPDWSIVKEVNSKAFSFQQTPQLAGSALLETESQANTWLAQPPYPKVLKSCYGFSGRGHLLIDSPQYHWDHIASFLHREWNQNRPVIAEPWVERILDFSTQWEIDSKQDLAYVGATLCRNTEKGQYLATVAGDEKKLFGEHLPFLKQHVQVVKPLLEKIAAKGYFGFVGIDAMVYQMQDSLLLHPVVEINARKTMGYAALCFQRARSPSSLLLFTYQKAESGALPSALYPLNKKPIHFQRNITFTFNADSR